MKNRDRLVHKSGTQEPLDPMKYAHYLTQRGNKYIFRIRYPSELIPHVKGNEFKRSLGTADRTEALARLPLVLQEYQNILEVARAELESAKTQTVSSRSGNLTTSEIMFLVAGWYEEAQQHYKPNFKPYSDKLSNAQIDEAREKLIQQTRESIELKKRNLRRQYYRPVWPIAAGLLRRKGFEPDPDDPSVQELSHTLYRAWIGMEQAELNRQLGEFDRKDNVTFLSELDTLLASEKAPSASNTHRAAESQKTLSDLIDGYKADKSDKWAASTVVSVETSMNFLLEVWGKDKPLGDIGREEAREVFDLLKKLPKNRKKHTDLEGLSIKDAVEKAAKLGLPTVSAKTVNGSYLAFIDTLFKWGVHEQWIEKNPFSGLNMTETRSRSQTRRRSFTEKELESIFKSAPWSTSERNFKKKPSLFWGPLLSLFHGMRLGEACGLKLSEVSEEDGIPIIHITEEADEERGVKSDSVFRVVPIHPELIKIGFLEFVKQQREAGQERLFPEARQDVNGKWGRHLTLWFNAHIKELGVTSSGMTFHCLRHNFQDALRAAGLHATAEGQALGGRATDFRAANLNADVVADEYGSHFKASHLLPHIKRVAYPSLDFTHLNTGQ